jgi:chemotaxis protein histidine kinase CheA
MGATILGDGRVTLILDVAGLVELSRKKEHRVTSAAGSPAAMAEATTEPMAATGAAAAAG